MPPTYTNEGLLAAQRSGARTREVGTVVLSQYVEVEYALKLVTGISERVGYLLKDRIADVAEFVAALRAVAAGGTVVEPSLVSELLAPRPPATRSPSSHRASGRCSRWSPRGGPTGGSPRSSS